MQTGFYVAAWRDEETGQFAIISPDDDGFNAVSETFEGIPDAARDVASTYDDGVFQGYHEAATLNMLQKYASLLGGSQAVIVWVPSE